MKKIKKIKFKIFNFFDDCNNADDDTDVFVWFTIVVYFFPG